MKIECESKFNLGDLVTPIAHRAAMGRKVGYGRRELVGMVSEIYPVFCYGGMQMHYSVRLCDAGDVSSTHVNFTEPELMLLPPVVKAEDIL